MPRKPKATSEPQLTVFEGTEVFAKARCNFAGDFLAIMTGGVIAYPVTIEFESLDDRAHFMILVSQAYDAKITELKHLESLKAIAVAPSRLILPGHA